MQYKTITYKRVKNLGNYQSEHLEMTIELDETDDVWNATNQLRHAVCEQLFPHKVTEETGIDDIEF